MNKIKNYIVEWIEINIFNNTPVKVEKVKNPYKNWEFKTTIPEGYKPFQSWTEEDRLDMFNKFKSISQ